MAHEIKKGTGENPRADQKIVPPDPGPKSGEGSTVQGDNHPGKGPEDDAAAGKGKR